MEWINYYVVHVKSRMKILTYTNIRGRLEENAVANVAGMSDYIPQKNKHGAIIYACHKFS